MDSIFVVAFCELCVRRPLATNRTSCGCETARIRYNSWTNFSRHENYISIIIKSFSSANIWNAKSALGITAWSHGERTCENRSEKVQRNSVLHMAAFCFWSRWRLANASDCTYPFRLGRLHLIEVRNEYEYWLIHLPKWRAITVHKLHIFYLLSDLFFWIYCCAFSRMWFALTAAWNQLIVDAKTPLKCGNGNYVNLIENYYCF